MGIVYILEEFSGWCTQKGVQGAFHMIKMILEALRIIVPIGLIVMTSLDIAKKVINPEEKDGQKKIMNRAIAALIVFLIPTIIKLVFNIIDVGLGSGSSYEEGKSNLSSCWGD